MERVREDGDSEPSCGSHEVLWTNWREFDGLSGPEAEKGMAPMELEVPVSANQLDKCLNQKRDSEVQLRE